MTARPVTSTAALALAIAAMCAVVVGSNILVQHPFEPFGLADYLTWGAFSYPFSFLVTDLTNRRFGVARARTVVYVGFALAVVLSIALATPRIAIASGTAFLVGQLADVTVFDRLRRGNWWRAPLVSSLIGSALDTMLFFTLAFAGDPEIPLSTYSLGFGEAVLPVWTVWAVCDFLVKITLALVALGPYRALGRLIAPQPLPAA
ncbi:MAG TPA: queuosine precursor transporter [Kaistiaceae bacterium]|nr:queuosine precursor transporter [Kaistiaceae bacterium]